MINRCTPRAVLSRSRGGQDGTEGDAWPSEKPLRRPDVSCRSARPAWIAIPLVPVGLALGVAVSLLDGEGNGSSAGGFAGLGPAVLSVAAPTAAVILAVRAASAGQPSARVAVAIAWLLLVGTFVVLPIAVISLGAGWIIALVAVVAVLGMYGWRHRNKPLRPA